ncbi:MAG: SMR family transporter [Myxococcota bacterium]
MAWVFLAVAIVANVLTNVALKRAAQSVEVFSFPGVLSDLITSHWMWVGFVSALVLVGCYMMAIRSLPLSVGYVSVTSMAMVGITLVGVLSGSEVLSVPRIIGICLVLAGVVLVGSSR